MSIPYEYVGKYAYRTDKRLGEGSYGKVFEGKDIRTNAPVAVKKIRSERYNRKRAQDLFQIETEILKSIKNDHVIKLIDQMETRNHKYLILELCNMNLRQFLNNIGRVEEQYALRLFMEIVQGLQSLHQKNYCHRDIKPDNILLKDGKIKIIDVNISKQISHTRFSLSIVGTPRYMAPEIKAKQTYSPYQADIFSLGVVFYELLYGLQDFQGERIFTFNKNVHLSDCIKNLIKNMLQPNPTLRWDWQQVALNLFQIHNTINQPFIQENESKLMSTIQTYYIDKWKNSINILKFIIEHIAILQISALSINPYPCALLIIKLIISATEKKVLSLTEQGLLEQNQELFAEIEQNSVLVQYRRDFLSQTQNWINTQSGVDNILKEEFIYLEQSERFQAHYKYFLKDFYKKLQTLNFTATWQQLRLKTLQFQLLLALDFYNDYEFAQSLLLSQSLLNGKNQSILIEKFNTIQEAEVFCQTLEPLLDNEDSDLNNNENQN